MFSKYALLISALIVVNAVYYVDEKTGIVLEEYHYVNTFEETTDNVTTTGTNDSDMYAQQPEAAHE